MTYLNHPLRTLYCVLMMLMLVGCSMMPKPEYHRLEAESSVVNASDGPSIGIRPIKLPEYLRRNGIVWFGQDKGLKVSTNQRWAEPLSDGVLRVTELSLASQLASASIRRFPWDLSARPDVVVSIVIVDIAANSGSATLVADVGVEMGSQQIASELRSWTLAITETPDGGSVAAAYSALLAMMAEDLAVIIKTSRASTPTSAAD